MQDAYPAASQPDALSDDDVLISRSDLEGNITYANQSLIDISGYSLDELIGAPHSLFRHPDMPSEVFKDLWATLSRGRTWQGVMKNRRQNGEGYWVDTTIAPLLDGERVVGYTAIRRQASDLAIARAEKAYARMQSGGRQEFALQNGAIRRSGPAGLARRFRFRSMQAKLIGMVCVAVMLLVLGGAAGVYGVTSSAERLRTLNQTGLEGIADLQRVEQRVTQTRQALEPAVSNPRRADLEELEAQLSENRRDIESVLERSDAEGNEVEQALTTYLTGFIDAADTTFTAIRDGDGFAAFEAFNDNLEPSSAQIGSTINQLVEQERQAAQALMAGHAALRAACRAGGGHCPHGGLERGYSAFPD